LFVFSPLCFDFDQPSISYKSLPIASNTRIGLQLPIKDFFRALCASSHNRTSFCCLSTDDHGHRESHISTMWWTRGHWLSDPMRPSRNIHWICVVLFILALNAHELTSLYAACYRFYIYLRYDIIFPFSSFANLLAKKNMSRVGFF
jgi:hypothetical protein